MRPLKGRSDRNWNPDGIAVAARRMLPYLQSRLPDDLDDLVETLAVDSVICTHGGIEGSC